MNRKVTEKVNENPHRCEVNEFTFAYDTASEGLVFFYEKITAQTFL